jgi:serine/threonine protein kinase
MRQLDHPNIIKLVDFSESRQYYYIVLELAPGGELFHQIVRLTYFSEELSRHVIVQVAQALEYLHEEKGVVHRYVIISLVLCCRLMSDMMMPLLTSFAPARPWKCR